ncbi:MAG: ChaB family protein [Nocardioidaceae bacterium]
MPKTTKGGKPKKSELPSTLQRSGLKAQRTFAKAHDSAVDEYGEGAPANRTAYAALKRSFEKVGDRWRRKNRKGPSDAKAAGGRGSTKQTAGGVDATASKKHLYDIAKELDISGRSHMSKDELVAAIQKANDKSTRKSRG